MILLVGMVSAFGGDTLNYWTFDDKFDDSVGTAGMKDYNMNQSEPSENCIIGTCISDQNYNQVPYSYMNNNTFDGTNVRTIDFWTYKENIHSGLFRIHEGFGGATDDYLNMWFESNKLNINYEHSGGSIVGVTPSTDSFADDAWYHIVVVQDADGLTVFVNGDDVVGLIDLGSETYMDSDFNNMGIAFSDAFQTILLVGRIDNFRISNTPYTYNGAGSDVNLSYNAGAGYDFLTPTPSTSDTLNISDSLPLNNTQFGADTIKFNLTMNASQDSNCTLYLNGVENGTNGYIPGDNHLVEFEPTFQIQTYNYFINCYDKNTSKNTTTKTVYIDYNAPTSINLLTNNSIIYGNLTGQFNFTDDVTLYSFNISIDGNSIDSGVDLNTTFYPYNLSYDATNLTLGSHELTVTYADGHTANKIGKYDWKNGLFNNYLQYDFSGKYIKIESANPSLFDSWSSTKQFDRYIFNYKPSNPKANQKFVVSSDEYISIIANKNKYGGSWIVVDDKWMDFVNPDEPQAKIKIKRLTDNSVSVSITGLLHPEKQKYNSIGDLNIVTEVYNFITTNATATYSSMVSETETQTLTLRVEKLGNVDSTTADLVYNGTTYAMTQLIYGDYDLYQTSLVTPEIDNFNSIVNLYFRFNATNEFGTTELQTTTVNQTIFQISISNCSNSSWAKALTFHSKDEEQDLEMSDLTLNLDLNVWIESAAAYRQFSYGLSGEDNYSICIYPNETTYYVDAVMEYKESNSSNTYANRKYYLVNYTLDNVTDDIYLYNLLESRAEEITIRVYDRTTGRNIPDAYVKVLRYYPETGVYKTVEVEKTDQQGQTLAKMVLYDVFYKFIVEKDGVVVLSTGVEKILSVSKVLSAVVSEDVLDSWGKMFGVSQTVTCTNSTNTCRFTWSDSTNIVQTATFKVWRFNGYGQVLISEQSMDSTAGTLVYTIIEDMTGNSYKAQGFIESNTAYSDYNGPNDWIHRDADLSNWGGVSALFPYLLLMLSAVFALIDLGAMGVIGGSLLVIITGFIIGIFPVTFGTITTLVVLGIILMARIKY